MSGMGGNDIDISGKGLALVILVAVGFILGIILHTVVVPGYYSEVFVWYFFLYYALPSFPYMALNNSGAIIFSAGNLYQIASYIFTLSAILLILGLIIISLRLIYKRKEVQIPKSATLLLILTIILLFSAVHFQISQAWIMLTPNP